MTIREAKILALEWVNKEAINIAGFRGAFYHGSINWLSEDDIFPPTSDIDVVVVLTDPQGYSSGKLRYAHLTLEVSYLPIEEFRSAEQLLGTFYWAGSFRKPNIIADQFGYLTKLQKEVAGKYAAISWVQQRCRDARDKALNYMEQMSEELPLHDQVTNWLFGRGLMVHMLLVAGLKNPTVRKRYVEVQKLLAEYDSLPFYERLLQSAGFANFSRSDVERHLITLTEVFNAASAVIRTPYRFAADISEIGRSTSIDGSYELLKAGFHREVMFWIVATQCRCQHILSQDAPLDVQEQHIVGFMRLLEDLNIASFNERKLSNKLARGFITEVWNIAEIIILQNPDIIC